MSTVTVSSKVVCHKEVKIHFSLYVFQYIVLGQRAMMRMAQERMVKRKQLKTKLLDISLNFCVHWKLQKVIVNMMSG